MEPTINPVPAYIATAVRWLLTTAAGYVVGKGWIDADTAEKIGVALLALLPLVWGLVQKRNAHAKLQKAIEAPEGRAE